MPPALRVGGVSHQPAWARRPFRNVALHPADCAWLNESLEHHLLKLELATTIRAADWHAELEVRAEDGTWRVDVLASSHDGTRRMAWEAQLSPITNADIEDRTARYRAEGVDVCWVSPAERVPWMGTVASIRVRDPQGERPWAVVDGPAAFDYEAGVWTAVTDRELAAFVRWVLHGQTVLHQALPRYQRIWFAADERYRRRHLIWTTSQHVESEARHEQKRQRQEAWKRQQEEKERLAEEQRQREAQARREEEARERERQAEAARIRMAEQNRQWAIEAEQRRIQREAEEQQRQEQARAAEAERIRCEQLERQAAQAWSNELSGPQRQDLYDAVATMVWDKHTSRVQFHDQGPILDTAYGTAVYLRGGLYGIIRPSPNSLHRLPPRVHVFVSNNREADLIRNNTAVNPDPVIHFDLPDHEQMTLM